GVPPLQPSSQPRHIPSTITALSRFLRDSSADLATRSFSLGLLPFTAALLFDLGETSLSIAGVVIAGFAVGGLFYTLTVSRLLPRIGVKGLMLSGASLVALQLVAVAMGPQWKLQAVSLLFMGWGFYMIHGCLQVFASELSVEAR